MTDLELRELNEIGFIPGPGEEEESFLKRVAVAKDFFREGAWLPRAHWAWVSEYLRENFDVNPLYIGARYENKGLMPWQGAAAWVGEGICWVQLNERLSRGNYLGYRREEILAHEAIHAARSQFEGKYEEYFAYMSSEKKWRRVLGPIVSSPWEVWPFLAALLLGSVWPACYLGAAVWVGLGFWRLIRGHRTLARASEGILKEVGDASVARAILFRLSESEIELFSKGVPVVDYAAEQNCLRWRAIKNYFGGQCGAKSSGCRSEFS